MTKRFFQWLTLIFFLGFFSVQARNQTEHERLRFKNDFNRPEDVVRYYCGRDASGFVWSGLLELERKAFTLWKEVPEHESFYIAREYTITPARIANGHAIVEVKYQILGMGDAHGTRLPAQESERLVTFHLKKVNQKWMIQKPDANEIAPVVIAEKFRYVN